MPCSTGADIEDDTFFLPPLIIWNPLLTYPSIVQCQLQFCMTCNEEITSTFYNDGSSQSKQPRHLHSMEDIVLLVSAVYTCRKGHKLVAHDERILKSFPSPIVVPFTLTHKTGFTKDFAENVFLLCRRGVNFYEIESLVLERRWEHFNQRIQLLQIHYKNSGKDCMQKVATLFEKFKKEHVGPSDNLISRSFLSSFLDSENAYVCNLLSLEVSESISFDHTFKVASNIGHLRQDGIWVPQYDSLFLVLDSCGKVLTWQLTKGTSFGKVTKLLQDLSERAAAQNKVVKFVYVDDCCKLRRSIQSVFGEETVIKLDLFHAVQRITKTMKKRHPEYHNCVGDLRLVFRKDGDVSQERQSHTAPKDVIASKLASFSRKWKDVTDAFGNRILTTSSLQAIRNLEKHVISGCLSDIPPGMGTNRNERFHRHLNSLMRRTRIGIMLAYALLTVLIHAHNNSQTVANKKLVTTNYISCSGHSHKPVGLIASNQTNFRHAFANADQWEQDCTIEMPSPESIQYYHNSVAKLALMRALEFMKLNNLSQSHKFELLNADELKLCQACSTSENSPNVEEELLKQGLCVKEVSPDGNCFFASVAVGILHSITNWSDCLERVNFKKDEGLNGLVRNLRNAFVTELLQNSIKYKPFFVSTIDYDAEASKFSQNGFFIGELGDLMPTAMAAVIQAPIVIFSDISNKPLYFSTPDMITSKASVCVLYRASLSHYDALVKSYDLNSSSTSPNKSSRAYCNCGVNKKTEEKSCCPSPIYSSRCKCLRLSQPCSLLCRCKNCNNPNGKRPMINAAKSRKRQSHTFQMKIPTAKSFAQERDQTLCQGAWSDYETILLLEIGVHNDPQEVTDIYNKLVLYSKSMLCTLTLPENVIFRMKSLSQVRSKLMLHK